MYLELFWSHAIYVLGVKCGSNAVFVYSRIGGNLVLPCANLLLSDCSPISWTFFTSSGSWNSVVIRKGQAGADSHKSNHISMTSNCSLSLRDLQEEHAGSYTCCKNGTTISVHYLSLLTITSVSTITSLQPGRNLSLNCILFTYFDTGNCRSHSMFNLTWVSEDGTTLPSDNRFSPFLLIIIGNLIPHTHTNTYTHIHTHHHHNHQDYEF